LFGGFIDSTEENMNSLEMVYLGDV